MQTSTETSGRTYAHLGPEVPTAKPLVFDRLGVMRNSRLSAAILILIFPLTSSAAKLLSGGVKLLNGNLNGWEVVGDGIWTVMRDGTLLGQRDPKKAEHQSWLYTAKNDYGEFDLHLEWWTPASGNSGVSLRDTSRAQYAVGAAFDPHRTPAHVGYEIQILNGY